MAGGYTSGIDTSYKVVKEDLYKDYNASKFTPVTIDKTEIYKDYVPSSTSYQFQTTSIPQYTSYQTTTL